jgi:hypothetical protein
VNIFHPKMRSEKFDDDDNNNNLISPQQLADIIKAR